MLVYRVLGYDLSVCKVGDTDPSNLYDAEGVIFGLYVDWLVSDRVILAAEVLQRTMDTDCPFDADVTTLSIRAGMKF